MSQNKVLEETKAFAQKCLAGEGTGHDWWHIERVLANAKQIHKTEGGNWYVITLAILLHDVGDRKVLHSDEDDYTIAENFLHDQKVDHEVVMQIMFIIRNMSFSKSLSKKRDRAPIEFYIVQDADRLDAIGAIGIARAFAYGGSKSRPLYDPTKKAQSIASTRAYRKLESSSFHHFEEKLLRLKDLMNTKSATTIARGRHRYMKEYMKQFLAEWKGKR